MKRFIRSFIVWFSEAIWIYYTIALFVNEAWALHISSDHVWWLITGLIGYGLHRIAAGRVHFLVSISISAVLIGLFMVFNWQAIVPEGHLGFGIAVSAGLAITFIRSAGTVYKEPTRLNMMARFEGNILLYVLFVILFSVKQWMNLSLHVFFISSIFMSLLGMILTLGGQDGAEGEHEQAEVRTVGRSGWFTGVMAVLLLLIAALCFLLLLPFVRQSLFAVAFQIWSGLKWLGTTIGYWLTWLMSLLPESEPGELSTPMDPGAELPAGGEEGPISSVPIFWLGVILAVIIIIAAIIAMVLFLKKWKPPASMKPRRIVIYRESWWYALKGKLIHLFRQWRKKWMMRFPRYYHLRLYWIFYQLEVWGRKQGLPRLSTETSKEYVEKLIRHLPEEVEEMNQQAKRYPLPEMLRQLNTAYQAAYYGGNSVNGLGEFDELLQQLKGLSTR